MKVVILAGGKGKRLWPVSRENFPKQFLKIGDDLSLLQRTVKRFLSLVPTQDITIVTCADYQHLVVGQLKELEEDFDGKVLIEPCPKGTALAIALAVKYLEEVDALQRDEAVIVASSDHWISSENAYIAAMRQAQAQAEKEQLVIFGVTPTKPETGYGYIKIGPELDTGVNVVERFVEKPALEKAQEYIRDPHYLWNSGIFAFTPDRLWRELEQHSPHIFAKCQESLVSLKDSFEDFEPVSFDCAVVEKARGVVAITFDFTWSDMGSWDSLFDVLQKDDQGNAKEGNVLDINTKNCLIKGGKRLISTIGLEDMLIVETEDALFVGKRGESQQVKTLVEALDKQGMKEVVEHRTTYRPWGSYTILEESNRYKVKRIRVEPGQKLSLQYHYHRSEHWVIVKGVAKVRIGEKEHCLHENESVYVPKSTVHRLENPGKVPLEMIEVQVGEYVGEDDIVRLEDIYGRLQPAEAIATS